MLELQANTEVKVRVGPFVDVGDGFTPQTDIALSGNEAELLKHNGVATVDISGNTWAAISDCRGWYDLTLTTTDTNTEGLLTVVVQDDSDCLPVYCHFMVLAQAAWLSKYTAKDTGFMDVDIKAVGGTATPHTTGKLHVLNGDGAAITAVGPTKAEMDTAHALLATEAKQDIIDTVVDGIQTDLSNATDGLGALKTLIEAVPTASEIQTEMEENGASLLDTIRDELANGTDGLTALKALIDAAQGDITTIAGYTDILDHATNGLANIKSLIDALDTVADAIKDKTDLLPSEPAKNVALSNFTFLMVLASDHITPATGKTITSQISKDGGAFANCTNSVSEIANGFYKISLTQTEMNANIVALKFTETNCDQRSIVMVTST